MAIVLSFSVSEEAKEILEKVGNKSDFVNRAVKHLYAEENKGALFSDSEKEEKYAEAVEKIKIQVKNGDLPRARFLARNWSDILFKSGRPTSPADLLAAAQAPE